MWVGCAEQGGGVRSKANLWRVCSTFHVRRLAALCLSLIIIGPLVDAHRSIAASDSHALSILVMGDSYSAGNGAGDYYGPAGCRRSYKNYAEDFKSLVEAAPYRQPATVTNVACSGDTTDAIFHATTTEAVNPRIKSTNAPQLDALKQHSYNVIFLTIGGDNVDFSGIVKYCLINPAAVGDHCLGNLVHALTLLRNRSVESAVSGVLSAIRANAAPSATIVLLGYPYLIRNTGFTLVDRKEGTHSIAGDPCGERVHGTNVVTVGKCLIEIGDLGDTIQQDIVNQLNAKDHTNAFVFVKTKALFEGTQPGFVGPNHALTAPIARFSAPQPNRWFVQPYWDTASVSLDVWYHPNPTGWEQEARLLLSDPSVPKHPPAAVPTQPAPPSSPSPPAPVQVPTAGPTFIYQGATAGNPNDGDLSFDDWQEATGQRVDTGDLLPSDLAAYRCVVLDLNESFASTDQAQLDAYLQEGGTIVAMGEHSDGDGFDAADNAINGMASSLGATMSLNDDQIDEGDTYTFNIQASPLTSQVEEVGYNWSSTLSLTGSAQPLVLSADDSSTLVASQPIGTGTFVMSGDTNAFSDNNSDFYSEADNGVLVSDICP
jgi:GDSL-like Lipase/Acylhydrolase family